MDSKKEQYAKIKHIKLVRITYKDNTQEAIEQLINQLRETQNHDEPNTPISNSG